MGDFYLVSTYFGDRVLPKGTKIGVQLKDGSFQPVPVEDAKRFAGKASTLFEKKFIDISAEELESRLMQMHDGPFSYYRQTKLSLHEQEGETFVPKLSAILKRTHEQSGQSIDCFIDEAYKSLQENATKQSFETVKRETLEEWYKGNQGTVAPEDWRNFEGLLKLAEKYSAANEFAKFSSDFNEYVKDPEASRFLDNIYYAYKYYRKQKSKFGTKTCKILKKTDKTNRNYGQTRIIAEEHDRAIEDFIMQTFYQDIDQSFVATALLEVKHIVPDGSSTHVRGVGENGMSRKGVYVVKDQKFEMQVPTKTQVQLARDVVIIERSLLNRVFYYTIEKKPELLATEQTYINFLIEERVRKNQVSKKFLGLEKDQVREAERIASQHYKDLFESQTANLFFGLSQDSLQNMRDVYNSVVYFFPRVLEEFVNSRENLARMQLVAPPTKQSSKDKWQERMSGLQHFVRENEEIAEQLSVQLGIKGLVTERICDSLMLLSRGNLTKQVMIDALAERYSSIVQTGKQLTPDILLPLVKQINYNEQDITEVLARYGLEEFIANDPEIQCQRILYS